MTVAPDTDSDSDKEAKIEGETAILKSVELQERGHRGEEREPSPWHAISLSETLILTLC